MNPFDVLGGVGDSEEVRTVAAALAGMEADLHEAIQAHYEALGIDPPDDRKPPEERIDRLCRLVEHHFEDDLWSYYVAEQAPEGLRNAEAAREHAGKSDEAWEETVARLAEQAPGDGTERERAGEVLEERFGVDCETFRRSVVEWSEQRTLKRALRGPIDTDVERLRIATAALERNRERNG